MTEWIVGTVWFLGIMASLHYCVPEDWTVETRDVRSELRRRTRLR